MADDTAGTTPEDKIVFDSGYDGDTLVKTQADLQAIADGYTNHGYNIASVDTLPATFDSDETVDQQVTIHLKHQTKETTPTNPGNPGQPVDSSNPGGPTWPIGTDKTSLQTNSTHTIHYVYADGTKTTNDVVQTVTFERTATVDLVTGTVSYTAWTALNNKISLMP